MKLGEAQALLYRDRIRITTSAATVNIFKEDLPALRELLNALDTLETDLWLYLWWLDNDVITIGNRQAYAKMHGRRCEGSTSSTLFGAPNVARAKCGMVLATDANHAKEILDSLCLEYRVIFSSSGIK